MYFEPGEAVALSVSGLVLIVLVTAVFGVAGSGVGLVRFAAMPSHGVHSQLSCEQAQPMAALAPRTQSFGPSSQDQPHFNPAAT